MPWCFQGRILSVRITEKTVEFYDGENLVKTHPRRRTRGRQTDEADLPPDKVAFYQRTPQWCLRQAKESGSNVFEAVRQILLIGTLTHLRQAQGVLRLLSVYGPLRLDAACRRALEFEDPSYRTTKRILANGMDQLSADLLEADRARLAKAYLRGKDTFALAGGQGDTGEE